MRLTRWWARAQASIAYPEWPPPRRLPTPALRYGVPDEAGAVEGRGACGAEGVALAALQLGDVDDARGGGRDGRGRAGGRDGGRGDGQRWMTAAERRDPEGPEACGEPQVAPLCQDTAVVTAMAMGRRRPVRGGWRRAGEVARTGPRI